MSEISQEQKLENYEKIGQEWSEEQIIQSIKFWETKKKEAQGRVLVADDKLHWFNYALQKAKLKKLKND